MYIEELREGEVGTGHERSVDHESCSNVLVVSDAKRVLVGAGARALFYPTLLYNIIRNKVQTEFRWWDRVDEFILLGAVPFPTDVPRLRELGVGGVVTVNEPYETLVSTSLYQAFNIDHLVIPTRDYLFAPSFCNVCLAVDFIHKNASLGRTTYVHCKAGQGRSTTIVLCYMVRHKQMTPEIAYNYVKSVRPRVLLASSQWQAVQDDYFLMVKYRGISHPKRSLSAKPRSSITEADLPDFDDDSVVIVTKSDLDGYDKDNEELGTMSIASQPATARLSCLWPGSYSFQIKQGSSSLLGVNILGNLGISIRVY